MFKLWSRILFHSCQPALLTQLFAHFSPSKDYYLSFQTTFIVISLSSSLLVESTLNPGQSQDEEPQWTCNVVQDHKQCNDQRLHGVHGAYTNTRSVAYIPLFKPWMYIVQYICTSNDKRAELSGIFTFLCGCYKCSQAAVLVQLDVSLPQLQGLLEHTSSFVLFEL